MGYSSRVAYGPSRSPNARPPQIASHAGTARHHDLARSARRARSVLTEWTDRLRADAGDTFPEKVTAFHPELAVHGKFGRPCPACGAPVQRIVYAENECNYFARCQNGGIILADRALSRLLHRSWPRSIDR
jgi:formamidopyrimidine-DNA glycosylase